MHLECKFYFFKGSLDYYTFVFQIENRIHVKKTFCRALIQSRSLSKGKVDLLLLFMLDNHKDIFKVLKFILIVWSCNFLCDCVE